MASKAKSIESIDELFCIPLSDGRYGGYKLDLLKQNLSAIEEKFVVCPSCKGTMKNASFCAGKNMCECCCPESEQTVPVESVRETVNKLPCGCPLDSKGCAWSGVIGELETHLGVCEHLTVHCPFVEYGCEIGLVRRLEMQLHLKEFSTQHMLGRIMKVEEENRKAFSEIDCLKKENQRAFEEIDLLKKKINCKELSDLKIDGPLNHSLKSDLRQIIKDKELRGFEFVLYELIKSEIMIKGPIINLEKYNIQVYYKYTPYLYLYIMRIPGAYDSDLGDARVGVSHYQIINSEDSKIIIENSNNLNHSLVFDKFSPLISSLHSAKFVVIDALTIRLFLELKLE